HGGRGLPGQPLRGHDRWRCVLHAGVRRRHVVPERLHVRQGPALLPPERWRRLLDGPWPLAAPLAARLRVPRAPPPLTYCQVASSWHSSSPFVRHSGSLIVTSLPPESSIERSAQPITDRQCALFGLSNPRI